MEYKKLLDQIKFDLLLLKTLEARQVYTGQKPDDIYHELKTFKTRPKTFDDALIQWRMEQRWYAANQWGDSAKIYTEIIEKGNTELFQLEKDFLTIWDKLFPKSSIIY